MKFGERNFGTEHSQGGVRNHERVCRAAQNRRVQIFDFVDALGVWVNAFALDGGKASGQLYFFSLKLEARAMGTTNEHKTQLDNRETDRIVSSHIRTARRRQMWRRAQRAASPPAPNGEARAAEAAVVVRAQIDLLCSMADGVAPARPEGGLWPSPWALGTAVARRGA